MKGIKWIKENKKGEGDIFIIIWWEDRFYGMCYCLLVNLYII